MIYSLSSWENTNRRENIENNSAEEIKNGKIPVFKNIQKGYYKVTNI